MIEQWMEENAATDPEVNRARARFRVELVKVDRFARDLQNPEKVAQIADLPPHLVGMK
jgi:hypothetical protein